MSAKEKLAHRSNVIRANLGALAYERRELQIKIERIDEQVAQMEAQYVLIEETIKDLNLDEAAESERRLKEKHDLKEARSERAKAAEKKRKRTKAA